VELKSSSRVVEEFVADHRRMTRGLADLLSMLRRRELSAAIGAADLLDREAGAHIEFEEHVLYPEVGRSRGPQLEEKLRDEHEVVRRGLLRLQKLPAPDADDPQVRAELERAFETAIQHAEHCGTLISHLAALSPQRQQEALGRLEEFRRAGRRWTELHGDE
jgi:hypothetical protein